MLHRCRNPEQNNALNFWYHHSAGSSAEFVLWSFKHVTLGLLKDAKMSDPMIGCSVRWSRRWRMSKCDGTVENGGREAVMDAVLQTDYWSESFCQTGRWCWVSSRTVTCSSSLIFITSKFGSSPDLIEKHGRLLCPKMLIWHQMTLFSSKISRMQNLATSFSRINTVTHSIYAQASYQSRLLCHMWKFNYKNVINDWEN